jgi:hypothetical protein
LRQFLSSGIGIGFIGVNETPIGLGSASFTVDLRKPTSAEQCIAWEKLLDSRTGAAESDRTPQLLAGQFNFSLSDIHQAVTTAHSTAPQQSRERIWGVCRNMTRHVSIHWHSGSNQKPLGTTWFCRRADESHAPNRRAGS